MASYKTEVLKYFPESIHHLVRHVLKTEQRKLYSVGRIGDCSDVDINQIRAYPYEIVNVEVVPSRGAIVRTDFRNKSTGESDETFMWTEGERFVQGLESKLGIRGSEVSLRKFWNSGDYRQNNKYLKIFRGTEVTGVAVERTFENGQKSNRLMGILM